MGFVTSKPGLRKAALPNTHIRTFIDLSIYEYIYSVSQGKFEFESYLVSTLNSHSSHHPCTIFSFFFFQSVWLLLAKMRNET